MSWVCGIPVRNAVLDSDRILLQHGRRRCDGTGGKARVVPGMCTGDVRVLGLGLAMGLSAEDVDRSHHRSASTDQSQQSHSTGTAQAQHRHSTVTIKETRSGHTIGAHTGQHATWNRTSAWGVPGMHGVPSMHKPWVEHM